MADEKLDDSWENSLSEMEGRTWPVIAKLAQRDRLSRDERLFLSTFLSLLMCRTPEFDASVRAAREGAAKAMVEKGWLNEAPSELLDHSREQLIAIMKRLSHDLPPVLASLNWVVLHAPPGSSFILTDDPFITVPPRGFPVQYRGVGILTRGARKFVPLTANICLHMGEQGAQFRHGRAGAGMVRAINFELAIRAFNNAFARDEALLRSIVKRARLSEPFPGPRVVVN